MSAEENKALVRRYVEEFVDRSNFDLSEEIFAPNFVRYDAGPDQVSRVEDLKHFFAMLHSGFPGFQSTIEDLLSEGDKVALRFTFRGIHQGEFMGIAPTGKEVTMSGIEILRIADGKLVEMWNQEDVLGMMRQLGAIPEPDQSEEASPT
jgi:predicted ester cyclase